MKAGTYTAVVTAEDASGSKTLEKEVKLAEDGSSETETESESETERETETQQPSTEAPNPNTGKETERKIRPEIIQKARRKRKCRVFRLSAVLLFPVRKRTVPKS